MGNVDGTLLFSLDLSGISTSNKALLTINTFKTMILNYASNDFPIIYYLVSPQISGYYD